eukprot:TRINITY_DN91741_c0_g1_i4.p2 TRINITY_DN91741_c0_g1~~TRINITY_DN91741_c0_g1_i4.p2  ORF type:complete len:125 (-),score=2.59 TRINITY_DN91741_c0_g1_i4:183-557(-)
MLSFFFFQPFYPTLHPNIPNKHPSLNLNNNITFPYSFTFSQLFQQSFTLQQGKPQQSCLEQPSATNDRHKPYSPSSYFYLIGSTSQVAEPEHPLAAYQTPHILDDPPFSFYNVLQGVLQVFQPV